MASAPKQVNGDTLNNNGSLGKRKKSRGSKGSYLSKWLDKTMHHIQESTPSMDTYDSFVSPNVSTNWPIGSSQFAPGYDPYKQTYGCAPEPLSLPTLPTYYAPPMVPLFGHEYRCIQNVNKSIQVQRPRLRRRSDNKAEEVYSNPQEALASTNCSDTQDFASLPPIVTSVADTNSNSDMNANDNASNTRRYSDPCVSGLPDVAKPANGDVDSASESSSGLSGSQVGSRLLTCLLDQIAALKLTNERLNKELQETKGLLGGQYSLGFLTDLVREIRDAARMREEAMYSRVRTMMVERNDNGLASSEAKFMEKTLEEIKSSLRASEADKRRMMDRIVKLEEELRVVRLTNGLDSNENKITNGTIEDTEAERLRLRKEVAELRKAKQNAEDHASKRIHMV